MGFFTLLVLALLAGTAAAQDSVVIYRCTDATGAVSVQNDIPCAKGSQQQRRVIETVHPPSPPPPSRLPPAPPDVAPTQVLPTVTPLLEVTGSPVEDPRTTPSQRDEPDPEREDTQPSADLHPPPPLFSCRRWDRGMLLTDDAVPASRCAPLETTGLDGNPAGGTGLACEIRRDTCEPVAADQLCEQWRKYLNDTEAILQFGRAQDPAATRAEIERIGAIVRASDCRR